MADWQDEVEEEMAPWVDADIVEDESGTGDLWRVVGTDWFVNAEQSPDPYDEIGYVLTLSHGDGMYEDSISMRELAEALVAHGVIGRQNWPPDLAADSAPVPIEVDRLGQVNNRLYELQNKQRTPEENAEYQALVEEHRRLTGKNRPGYAIANWLRLNCRCAK